MSKSTTISLVARGHDGKNIIKDFEFNHAERLLMMKNNGGWKLPDDSLFKFENNALIIRNSKGGNSEPAKKANPGKS